PARVPRQRGGGGQAPRRSARGAAGHCEGRRPRRHRRRHRAPGDGGGGGEPVRHRGTHLGPPRGPGRPRGGRVLTLRKPLASIAFRAVLPILGLGAVACTAARPAPPAAPLKPLRMATLDEVLAAYDSYCESGTTLSASGNLDVRDRRTGKGRTLGVRVIATRGGRLYLKGSVSVITAVEVVSNGERFWFQVPSKKTVWTGAAAGEARDAGTDDAPYQAIRPADITSALLPEPLTPREGETVLLDADRDAFTLTLAAPAQGRGV